MKTHDSLARLLGAVTAVISLAAGTSALNAGVHFIDFNGDGVVEPPGTSGLSLGSAPGWDAFPQLVQGRSYPLTDLVGTDNDVLLTAVDDSFDPNNPGPPGVGTDYNGIPIPREAVDDYLFKRDDTAGTSARIKVENLDAGEYDIVVFEGRLTDPSQFAKIWVGDSLGSGEPASENTGNFAQGFSTVNVTIARGDTLWYRHLEDNTGGLSGMLILQTAVPEPASGLVLLVGGLSLVGMGRRRR